MNQNEIEIEINEKQREKKTLRPLAAHIISFMEWRTWDFYFQHRSKLLPLINFSLSLSHNGEERRPFGNEKNKRERILFCFFFVMQILSSIIW